MKVRIKKLFILGIPVAVSTTGVGIYYAVKSNQVKTRVETGSNEETNNESWSETKTKSVFASITFDEIYDEIIMENKTPIISDEMIAKMIKLVIMRSNTSQGKIKVEIAYRTRTNVELKFMWIFHSKVQETKIYNMKLNFQDLV